MALPPFQLENFFGSLNIAIVYSIPSITPYFSIFAIRSEEGGSMEKESAFYSAKSESLIKAVYPKKERKEKKKKKEKKNKISERSSDSHKETNFEPYTWNRTLHTTLVFPSNAYSH